MLILSRKNGQKIIINDEIVITILDSKNDNCKIAIEAPRDVKVYREEVYKQIQQTNQQSDNVSVEALGNLSGLMPSKENAVQKTVIVKKKQQ